ncbi:hypothetical protein nvc1_077, partial [Namao virus]
DQEEDQEEDQCIEDKIYPVFTSGSLLDLGNIPVKSSGLKDFNSKDMQQNCTMYYWYIMKNGIPVKQITNDTDFYYDPASDLSDIAEEYDMPINPFILATEKRTLDSYGGDACVITYHIKDGKLIKEIMTESEFFMGGPVVDPSPNVRQDQLNNEPYVSTEPMREFYRGPRLRLASEICLKGSVCQFDTDINQEDNVKSEIKESDFISIKKFCTTLCDHIPDEYLLHYYYVALLGGKISSSIGNALAHHHENKIKSAMYDTTHEQYFEALAENIVKIAAVSLADSIGNVITEIIYQFVTKTYTNTDKMKNNIKQAIMFSTGEPLDIVITNIINKDFVCFMYESFKKDINNIVTGVFTHVDLLEKLKNELDSKLQKNIENCFDDTVNYSSIVHKLNNTFGYLDKPGKIPCPSVSSSVEDLQDCCSDNGKSTYCNDDDIDYTCQKSCCNPFDDVSFNDDNNAKTNPNPAELENLYKESQSYCTVM